MTTATEPMGFVKTRERVCLDLIDPNPWQPRLQEIVSKTVRTLADSIHQLGLLQAPLGRRTEEGRIQLAFGHRRVAACWLLYADGLWDRYIEMDIAELSDQDMAVIAITENENREELSQLELIRGYRRAVDETGLSVQGLADRLGMSRPRLANNLRVLTLPDFILEHVESGDLKLTIAREFLVLQSADHAHSEDMQGIVAKITNPTPWEAHPAPPDWTRRNVRLRISERVAYNEKDYRPMEPKPEQATAGATREPTFDVEAFMSAHQETQFHRIPVGGTTDTPGRLWTCAVRDWTREQTRATREANKTRADVGAASPKDSTNRNHDQTFERVLARDPVWKRIAAAREETGPDRPQTEQERQQLGTRGEFREVGSFGSDFMKILQRADADQVHIWSKDHAGMVPPWFPDLDECRNCTIGASYAQSKWGGFGLDRPTLVCFNQDHYEQKLAAGEAKYREKKDAQRKGMDKQDAKAIKRFTDELQTLSDAACQALVVSLLTAQPELEWQHPIGRFHEDWSYEGVPAARVRELTALDGDKAPGKRLWRWTVIAPESLQAVAPTDFRELAAALMAHHLRLAGKLDTSVSRETDDLPPAEGTAVEPAPVSRSQYDD